MSRILWLDNDLVQTHPYTAALKRQGFHVDIVRTVTECEKRLQPDSVESHYDLLILDVMVPTKNALEELNYPPETTQRGLLTGLAMWERWSSLLLKRRTRTLVLTARLDRAVKERFLSLGLPEKSFATKLDLRDPEEFVGRVNDVIKDDETSTRGE